MNRDPLQIVVLDDISRFACHVWQYLAEGVSFGIGNLPYDGTVFGDGDGTASLPTPDGEAEIRWINVDRPEWRKSLQTVWQKIRSRPCCLLIDVRGSSRSASFAYSPESAIEALNLAAGEKPEILLISSYYTGERELPPPLGFQQINAKTWKVLERVRRRLTSSGPPAVSWRRNHVLVTGAGFELAESEAGAHGLGMLWTEDLLKNTWNRLRYNSSDHRYPAPQFPPLLAERFPTRVKELERAAQEADLDSYWNEALAMILEEGADRHSGQPARTLKLAASWEEYRVREEFRQALLDHDWGHLNQALDAAELPWLTWLSTNYTGFADRALALARRNGKRSWRIISTSNEAVHVARQIRHAASSTDGGTQDAREAPILFKLHGHGEHLLTMAIAGQDKEIYSSLSLPVDSLHEVYTSAEIFLKNALEDTKGLTFWHIVGHSLNDVLLRELIEEAMDSGESSDGRHVVLFVGPKAPQEAPKDFASLKGSLKKDKNYHAIPLTARQYLARLRRADEPPTDPDERQRWLREIVTGEEEI